jgi:ATP-dependent DNA helicase RecG
VAQGESETLEFKASTGQRSDGMKAACGMLNGVGGFVLFGVRNDAISGQDIGVETLEDVAAELRRIEPPAFPDIETVMLDTDAL